MRKSVLFLSLLAISFLSQGQETWVFFTDKSQSNYSLDRPEEFLSPASIQRRVRQNIPLNSSDLPVPRVYVASVQEAGFEVRAESRWLNAIVVSASEDELDALKKLPFVSKLKPVQKLRAVPAQAEEKLSPVANPKPSPQRFRASLPYGPSYRQIEIMNGVPLHDAGYLGQGMTIAVLDAGFIFTNQLAVFDSLNQSGRLKGTRDFVGGGTNVYQASTHGTSVLSLMAGYLPDSIIGSAPRANYYLIRTEDVGSETLIEEYYWLQGAEYADSVGADIINSSLGYTTMDDPNDSHSYSDMDGNTTLITKAADWAAGKGILVVNSAGNSGLNSWRYIGAPADGDSVLAVGAVNKNAVYAPFSSHGPSYDGRVKPNVSCQGQDVYYATLSGGVAQGNGTSFASPLCAGMAACLWQANPGASNMDILQSIQESSHKYNNPDTLLGHGIPNFALIMTIGEEEVKGLSWKLYPNPSQGRFMLNFSEETQAKLQIYDLSGRLVYQDEINKTRNEIDLSKHPSGMYILQIHAEGAIQVQKLIIE